ncbi:hypothetical protein TrVE_jg2453 [Triparma verrucosa]|uniref:rhomboid protease n=1 Tax=Triparma verrucosa TaxID=1606542 RepID=A0A9W7F2C1_9STRA|nr:hypothetical protein TrVE_jg2453 [Triparma verrucosa]
MFKKKPSTLVSTLRKSKDKSNSLLPSTVERSEVRRGGEVYEPPVVDSPTGIYIHNISESASTSSEDSTSNIPYSSFPLTILLILIEAILVTIPFITCTIAPFSINPMFGPYPTTLDAWGAKNAYKMIVDGEWERLITPIFLHAGLIHFVSNVVIQMDQCKQYESEWGSLLYGVIYVCSGVCGNLMSSVFKPGVLGVGASGAIMGVLGARVGEGLVKFYDSDGGIVDLSDTVCSIIIVMALSFVPFVDWPAHLGGAVSGVSLGIVFFSWLSWKGGKYKRRHKCKCFSIFVGIATFLGITTCISMLFLVNWSQYEELDDVCGHFEAYYAQFGEEFVCECDGNRAADYWNKYNNNDD